MPGGVRLEKSRWKYGKFRPLRPVSERSRHRRGHHRWPGQGRGRRPVRECCRLGGPSEDRSRATGSMAHPSEGRSSSGHDVQWARSRPSRRVQSNVPTARQQAPNFKAPLPKPNPNGKNKEKVAKTSRKSRAHRENRCTSREICAGNANPGRIFH